MHNFWLILLVLVPTLPLISDDFRIRQVRVLWLGVLFGISIIVSGAQEGVVNMMTHLVINGIVLISIISVMALYWWLRGHALSSFFTKAIGSGDLAMMLSVAPLFGAFAYLRYLLISFCAALIWWMVKRSLDIPLVSFLGLVLCAYCVIKAIWLWK